MWGLYCNIVNSLSLRWTAWGLALTVCPTEVSGLCKAGPIHKEYKFCQTGKFAPLCLLHALVKVGIGKTDQDATMRYNCRVAFFSVCCMLKSC